MRKRISDKKWQVYIDKGREKTGLDALKWAQTAENLGAGEIHLNSIDGEGTLNGFDYNLIKSLSKKIKVPVIAGGGLGNLDHLTKLAKMKGIDGISTSAALHYNHLKIDEIKTFLAKKKMNVRK